MEKMLVASEETKTFFVQAFKTNRLVPVFGVGFSCGMPVRKKNCIPTSTALPK
ncbi:hypothetical protein [Enterocloster clostridioformis]|uniref:hypothetical protein n=1 Tax=Enterocloster clostridioformis TaxID=1531 RepID=UPI0034A4C110